MTHRFESHHRCFFFCFFPFLKRVTSKIILIISAWGDGPRWGNIWKPYQGLKEAFLMKLARRNCSEDVSDTRKSFGNYLKVIVTEVMSVLSLFNIVDHAVINPSPLHHQKHILNFTQHSCSLSHKLAEWVLIDIFTVYQPFSGDFKKENICVNTEETQMCLSRNLQQGLPRWAYWKEAASCYLVTRLRPYSFETPLERTLPVMPSWKILIIITNFGVQSASLMTVVKSLGQVNESRV